MRTNIATIAAGGINQLLRFIPPYDIGNYFAIGYPLPNGSIIDLFSDIFGRSPHELIVTFRYIHETDYENVTSTISRVSSIDSSMRTAPPAAFSGIRAPSETRVQAAEAATPGSLTAAKRSRTGTFGSSRW
jgi:hypothetical protein